MARAWENMREFTCHLCFLCCYFMYTLPVLFRRQSPRNRFAPVEDSDGVRRQRECELWRALHHQAQACRAQTAAGQLKSDGRAHPSQAYRLRRARDCLAAHRRMGHGRTQGTRPGGLRAFCLGVPQFPGPERLQRNRAEPAKSEPSADLKRKQLKLLPDMEGSDTGTHPGGKKTGRKS